MTERENHGEIPSQIYSGLYSAGTVRTSFPAVEHRLVGSE